VLIVRRDYDGQRLVKEPREDVLYILVRNRKGVDAYVLQGDEVEKSVYAVEQDKIAEDNQLKNEH
jgi:hypothetical protein